MLTDEAELRIEALRVALPSSARRITSTRTRRFLHLPVPHLFTEVVGRQLTVDEQRQARDTYKAHLARQAPRLVQGAEELLRRLIRSGCSHSLVSASLIGILSKQVHSLAITDLFVRTDGYLGESGMTKKELLGNQVQALRPAIGERPVVVIGNTADAHAAVSLGLHAVLCTSTLERRDIGSRVEVAAAHTLAHAAALAVERTHRQS